ncbi:MAG: hypothetical protein KDD48_03190 [Bdellovibrionales bacterium]|nr:hypothetical protein [Bdellovibrionales bacterium]
MATSTQFHSEFEYASQATQTQKNNTSNKNKTLEINWLVSNLTDKVIESRASLVEETIYLGSLIRIQGDALRAFKLHKTLISRPKITSKERFLLMVELGSDLLTMRKGDFGKSYFEQSLTIHRKHPYALHMLSRVFEISGEFHKAVPLLKKLIHQGQKEETRLAYVLSEQAYTLMEQNQASKAKKISEEAMAIDPECSAAALAFADSHLLMAQFDLAIESLKVFVKKWPHLTFMAIKRLEDAHYRQDQYSQFEVTLRECITDNPDNAFLLYWIGKVLRKKKRKIDGIPFFKDALELKPLEVNSMRELIHYNLPDAPADISKTSKRFFEELRSNKSFICSACHHIYKSMHWLCSDCGNFGTLEFHYEFSAP